MSRFNITQDQIRLLSFDQLESLRLAVCDEMAELGKTEYVLYQQRRELELLAHPELAKEPEFVKTKPQRRRAKPMEMNINNLIQAARRQGVDVRTIMEELTKS